MKKLFFDDGKIHVPIILKLLGILIILACLLVIRIMLFPLNSYEIMYIQPQISLIFEYILFSYAIYLFGSLIYFLAG
ncbi:MAG: hypothetical protein IJ309_05730 [Clostridia bacterium]|nr:hypothetical protein [Clostridia bacterium]